MIIQEIPADDRRETPRRASFLGIPGLTGPHPQSRSALNPAAGASPCATPVRTILALWSQGRFIDPAARPADGSALASSLATITIHSHFVPPRTAPSLHTVKAHFAAQGVGGQGETPVHAWSANSQASIVRLPAKPAGGVLLSVELYAPRGAEDFYFLVSGHTSGKAQLMAGTYVLAAGSPSLIRVCLIDSQGTPTLARVCANGVWPVTFEYLLVTVA